MSPALPHTGAAYSFARSAMGPWGGMVTGLAESIEYILTPAVIVYFIGTYMTAIFETPAARSRLVGGIVLALPAPQPARRGAFVPRVGRRDAGRARGARDLLGERPPHFDLHAGRSNNGPWLPQGFAGVLATLPFAVWLFLAIEQLPLAAEESADPKKDMPKALILGMATLMVSALLTVSSIPASARRAREDAGRASLAKSSEPLLDGFRVIWGGVAAKTLAFLAVVGLIASFHTIIYAYGRQIYSLSRAATTSTSCRSPRAAQGAAHGALRGTRARPATMLVVWFVAEEKDAAPSSAARSSTWRSSAR
jgi:ethanolamine permease